MTLRIGVIGLGMGRHHARAYIESPKADLVAVCDLNESLLAGFKAAHPQVATFTRYQDMFAEAKLDAVSIALPNHLHAPVTNAALRAGLHVLCEKPMARNAAEAATMLETARASGKKLMIHLNYRFSPTSRFLKAYVDEGNLGEIYYARTRFLRARGIPKLGSWFSVKAYAGGGPLIDLGVHRLDLALWLMGYPRVTQVNASTFSELGPRLARQVGAQYDVEDMVVALIRLENGATLLLETSWAGGTEKREDMETALYGTGGAAIQRNTGEGYTFEALALRDIAGHLVQVSPRVYPRRVPSAIDEFIESIVQDREPEASAEQGLILMRIIDAIYRSAQAQCQVEV